MTASPLPILVTTPHCSGDVPGEIFARMRECGEAEPALRRRIFSEGDPFTDRLYDLPVKSVLRAPYSRFAVDLNRSRDESGPNGAIKSVDFQLRPLYSPDYRIDAAERERRLQAYYDPYHRAIENRLAGGGIRFLMDGHSLTGRGPAMGPDEGRPRPALCLGNFGDADGEAINENPVSLHPPLARQIRDYASKLLGETFPHWDRNSLALLNQPFDGGYILQHYTHPSYPHRVPGLLFEINRGLYLDEGKTEILPGTVEVWNSLLFQIASFTLEILK